mmetsp:Transcript_21752/g.62843  ORF Transcript_21752/g.62843 Transcript_21752/m.62843 type:complete len:333 (-) Transcript_21752:804-1802(-)
MPEKLRRARRWRYLKLRETKAQRAISWSICRTHRETCSAAPETSCCGLLAMEAPQPSAALAGTQAQAPSAAADSFLRVAHAEKTVGRPRARPALGAARGRGEERTAAAGRGLSPARSRALLGARPVLGRLQRGQRVLQPGGRVRQEVLVRHQEARLHQHRLVRGHGWVVEPDAHRQLRRVRRSLGADEGGMPLAGVLADEPSVAIEPAGLGALQPVDDDPLPQPQRPTLRDTINEVGPALANSIAPCLIKNDHRAVVVGCFRDDGLQLAELGRCTRTKDDNVSQVRRSGRRAGTLALLVLISARVPRVLGSWLRRARALRLLGLPCLRTRIC